MEQAMARDFFRGASRDVSPPHRWARRGKDRRSITPGKKGGSPAGSLRGSPQGASSLAARVAAPAPVVLSSRSKRVAADFAPAGSLQSGGGREEGKAHGDASPTGPLEFPGSPASSAGSFKEGTSPVPPHGAVRSRQSPSPNRGPLQQGLMPHLASPAVTAGPRRSSPWSNRQKEEQPKSRGGGLSGGLNSPSVTQSVLGREQQMQRQASAPTGGQKGPAEVDGASAGLLNREASAACAPGSRVPLSSAGMGGKKAEPAVRHATPFRRGLNAIKGKLFSEPRKLPGAGSAAEAAVQKEIRQSQQSLAAQHKVKPAASAGIKDRLVQRLTRALQRPVPQAHRPQLPAPAAAPQEPLHAASEQGAVGEATRGQPHGGDKGGGANGDEGLPKGAIEHAVVSASSPQQGPSVGADPEDSQEDSMLEQEKGLVKEPVVLKEGDNEAADQGRGVANLADESPLGARADLAAGLGWSLESEGSKAGRAEEQRSPSDSDSDSDLEEDSNAIKPISPNAPAQAPLSVVHYAPWAQRVPLPVSPAHSWDSQSSTEFANSRRRHLREHVSSSESSGSETGSPRAAQSVRGSLLFKSSTSGPPTLSPSSDSEATRAFHPAFGGPLPVTPPSGAVPVSPHPAAQRDLLERRSGLDTLLWSSDEEGEEDRSCRKREMAVALRQLKEFQAGGGTPGRPVPRLQRSQTYSPAHQVAKRAPSPLRTLWRQAAAATNIEGSGSKLLGLAVASRPLAREPSPSQSARNILATPRPLRPEASPQHTSARFADSPMQAHVWGAEVGAGQAILSKSASVPSPSSKAPSRASRTPGRSRPVAAAAAFFRSFTPGRQRPQVL